MLEEKYIVKVRGIMGPEEKDKKCVLGVKLQEEDRDDDELRGLDLIKYRSVVARANFVAQDRPDIRYSVKEL